MKSNQYDPKSHICWCLKKGIRLEAVNDNLCKAYLQKAKSALIMLNYAIEKNETDWIATTAYYSRYFSFYALLQKCGIKSEIHECTLSLMHYLFVEEKIIEEDFYKELNQAKELRVDVQYYVTDELDKDKIKADSKKANAFVLKMEEIIENIEEEKVKLIRKKIEELIRNK